MKRKTCTETQKYKGRKEQRVGRVLTRSVFVISYSSATSLCHRTILFCLLSIVYYLQLLANTFQTSFSSSSSIASVHINLFGKPLSQLPRLPGETGVAPPRSLSPHGGAMLPPSMYKQKMPHNWKVFSPLHLNPNPQTDVLHFSTFAVSWVVNFPYLAHKRYWVNMCLHPPVIGKNWKSMSCCNRDIY